MALKRVALPVGLLGVGLVCGWMLREATLPDRGEIQASFDPAPSPSDLPMELNGPEVEDYPDVSGLQVPGQATGEGQAAPANLPDPAAVAMAKVPDLMRIAFTSNDPLERQRALTEVLANLNPDNIQEALAILEEVPPRRGMARDYLLFVSAWAQFDPEGAADWSLASSSGRRSQWMANAALRTWAGSDPSSAVQWANQQEDPQQFYFGIVSGWGSQDPVAAASFASQIERGDERRRLLASIALDQASGEPKTAYVDWLATLSAGETRNDAATALALGMARSDPEAATTFLAQNHPETMRDAESVRELANLWARQSPEEAAHWVLSLENSEAGEAAAAQVMRQWTRVNPEAAGEWLNQFPSSPAIDPMVAQYVRVSASVDPAAAIGWAEAITDPQMRGEMVNYVMNRWVRENPEAAETYTRENPRP